jgi:nitrite reductase (NADH) large subunit
MAKQRLVVIGNGMAGARAVEEVLARGGAEQFDITMFGDEPYGNYNRILLSNVLSGIQDSSEIYINPLSWYEENDITLHVGAPVTQIDPASRMVETSAGVKAAYDVLLIATGSRSFLPPMKGLNGADGKLKPGVFGFRSIDDCSGIIETAKVSKRAAVIGGGLLGLEAARGLLNFGCETHVVHLGDYLMPAQLDPTGAAILRTMMEKMGVNIHVHKSTTEILGQDRVTGLAFKDGGTLDCDMVVVSAGIRPNVEIARAAGLTVERAIVVDNHMRCLDDMNIYSVGECAQHRGMVYGLVAPLWEQAKVFADHVTGVNRDAAYHGSKLATKLKVMGVELASMGITEPADERDEVIQFTEPRHGTYKKLIVRDGRLVGGILMGDISKAAYLMQAFDRDSPLPEERLSLLFDLGTPGEKVTLDEMPADTQVCNCNGVTKGAIGACVTAGKRSAKGVMAATRAGMGCGSCKSLVNELVEWFCGGDLEEDPSVHYYVPCIPMPKPELVQAIREQKLKSVSAVVDHLVERRIRRRTGCPIHQRPRTRQHPEGRHVLRRAGDAGRHHHAGRPDPHRAGGDEIRCAAGETDGRAADRSGRRQQGKPAEGLGGSGHARRLGLGQKLPHLQKLHWHRILPLRPGRQHGPRAEDRGEIPRHRQSRQVETRHRRLPTQLFRGDGEGCRRGGDRRRPLGNLCRRRGRIGDPQGRRAMHSDR